MKRKVLSLLLVAVPLAIFAQLKVNSSGKVLIKNTDNTIYANLTVGDNQGHNMHTNILSTITDNSYISLGGFLSYVEPTSYCQGFGIGVLGSSTNCATNFGIMGALASTSTGAGIIGSIGNIGSFLSGEKYAGYFKGATYVDGTLTATQVITPSDANLKDNVTSLTKSSTSVLDNLLNMNVIRYNYKKKEVDKENFTTANKAILEQELKYEIEQNQLSAQQIHFGLYAQELQEIYPELVQKGQDGNLGINYIELVPILIRSIQELKQELDAVKGPGDAKTRSAYNEEDYKVVTTQNVLYQNNPNPFKEQTIIRFSLANDIQNASICIFDLSGKMLKKFPISLGMDSVSVTGYELGEGMFLYSLIVNGQEIDTKKMVITK